MDTAVTNPRANALGAIAGLRSALTQVRATIPETSGLPFLRLLKDGDWVFGKDDHALPNGSEVIGNVLSIKHGYSCWTNKQPGEGKNEMLGEVMEPISRPLPVVSDLPQHAFPWKMQLSIDLKVVGGKHDGKELNYKTSSEGGVRALRGLIDAILAQLDVDEEYVFPVVAVGTDHYKHSQWGKTYVPVLEIVGWANASGEEAGEDPLALAGGAPIEPEPEPERPTPASLRAGREARGRQLLEEERAAQQAAAPEPEPTEPRRRRRT